MTAAAADRDGKEEGKIGVIRHGRRRRRRRSNLLRRRTTMAS